MKPDELFKNIKKYYIIDVRTREEYLREHIPNAINIPYWDFKYYIELIRFLKNNKDIVLYCNRGLISNKARKLLKEKGVDAETVTGGLILWKKAGLPIVKSNIVVVDEKFVVSENERENFENMVLKVYLKAVVSKGFLNFRLLKHGNGEYHMLLYWDSIENFSEFKKTDEVNSLVRKYPPEHVKIMDIVI